LEKEEDNGSGVMSQLFLYRAMLYTWCDFLFAQKGLDRFSAGVDNLEFGR
jgi:hypothetical protein